MNIQQMSGLAILQAMAKGELPAPSITQTMPMSLIRAEEGSVLFNATADDKHLHPDYAHVIDSSRRGLCAV